MWDRLAPKMCIRDRENTVILEGRNAKCMEVFDRWSGKGVRGIGVFYGAAHLPGLHGALLELSLIHI